MAGYKDPPAEHRFKPGQSGNPAGYSRRRRFSDALHALIDELEADRALMAVGLKKALEGNFAYWSFIVEHLEGKAAPQPPPSSETAQAAARDADAVSELLEFFRAHDRPPETPGAGGGVGGEPAR